MRICEVGRYSRIYQRMDFEQVEHVGAVSLDTWYAALAGLDVVNFLDLLCCSCKIMVYCTYKMVNFAAFALSNSTPILSRLLVHEV